MKQTWLKELGVSFIKEKAIGHCHVDVFIEPRTIVDIQGCYWHKHLCQRPKGGWSAADRAVQKRDEDRFAYFISQGYKVVTVYECELEKDPEWVRSLLKGLTAKT